MTILKQRSQIGEMRSIEMLYNPLRCTTSWQFIRRWLSSMSYSDIIESQDVKDYTTYQENVKKSRYDITKKRRSNVYQSRTVNSWRIRCFVKAESGKKKQTCFNRWLQFLISSITDTMLRDMILSLDYVFSVKHFRNLFIFYAYHDRQTERKTITALPQYHPGESFAQSLQRQRRFTRVPWKFSTEVPTWDGRKRIASNLIWRHQ